MAYVRLKKLFLKKIILAFNSFREEWDSEDRFRGCFRAKVPSSERMKVIY